MLSSDENIVHIIPSIESGIVGGGPTYSPINVESLQMPRLISGYDGWFSGPIMGRMLFQF